MLDASREKSSRQAHISCKDVFKDRMAIPAGYDLLAASDLDLLDIKSFNKQRLVEVRHHRFLCLRRACYSLVLFAVATIVVWTHFQPSPEIAPSTRTLLTLPSSMIPSYWHRETLRKVESSPIGATYIEDVVSLDSGEVLLLIRLSVRLEFPRKERIECRYGDGKRFIFAAPLAIHLMEEDRAGVLCGAPPADLACDVDSIRIVVDQEQEIRRGMVAPDYQHPLLWNTNNPVVYESFATDRDVVVFVHGIESSQKLSAKQEPDLLKRFQCVFGGRFETHVTSQAQEVFRCSHPREELIPGLAGKKVSLKFEGHVLPSVALYNPGSLTTSITPQQKPLHDICACTMIFNGAKFLKEWVHYHTHLGVGKFFLYDNNSEDNLDDVIAALNRTFNVTKESWPWVKTQEAGFSHCALIAQPQCKWMLFIDVDEYFFPHARFLFPQNDSSSRLAAFITEAVGIRNSAKVGQIMTFCHNYGPSGLTTSPPQGVTQGYTCRVKLPERHKSIVRLSAIKHSLANVIHHFGLKSGFKTKKIFPPAAVINHYKFQVWDEFRVKFKRRAATYVADWTENRNHASKDRVPDLGTTALKPVNWEQRYCEVQDFGLRNYTRSVFGSYDEDSNLHLAWERSTSWR